MEQRRQGLFLGRKYLYLWKRMEQSQRTFQSKKVGTLNCKRFRAGVAFRRVCKIIKIVGKVFVWKRLLTNSWKDAS